MTISERLKTIRKDKGLTLKQFGKMIGITDASVSQMETGKSGLSNQTIHSICREFGVSEEWLRTGKGEMYIHATSNEVDMIAEKYDLSPEVRILIERFIVLRPEIQKGIMDYVLDVANVINGMSTTELTKAEKLAQYKKELDEEEEAAERSLVSQTPDGDTEKMA